MNEKKILLIDDEELIRYEFEQIFAEAKYKLDFAVNSIEGLEEIKKNHYDLILLDIIMPDLKNRQNKRAGLELLKKIKEMKSNIPIIMVSVETHVKIAFEAIDLGAVDYITKDTMTSEELLKKVKKAFGITNKQSSKPDLNSLIRKGENETLEFKSTMRWSFKKNNPDKGIEFSWLKTIVAFMNTYGGILLIGVEDDRTILGIEADNFPNEDKYLLHFNNLIKQHIGLEFSKFIKYELVLFDDKKILFVECEKSDEPVFFRKTKEDEEFYIRVGPSSRKLSMSEKLKYLEGL
jgi:DNA-binding response OmpR family regulator